MKVIISSKFTILFILIVSLISVSSNSLDLDLDNTNTSLKFLTEYTEPKKKDISTIIYNIYSMVWSAKFYNPGETKYFFFAIPLGFNTFVKVDPRNNVITSTFTGTQFEKGHFKIVKEEAQKAEKISFSNKIMKFSEDYTKVYLSLDFLFNPDYELSNVKVYQNKLFRNIQIKITLPKSKVPKALYVTFDFSKADVPSEDVDTLVEYFNQLKK